MAVAVLPTSVSMALPFMTVSSWPVAAAEQAFLMEALILLVAAAVYMAAMVTITIQMVLILRVVTVVAVVLHKRKVESHGTQLPQRRVSSVKVETLTAIPVAAAAAAGTAAAAHTTTTPTPTVDMAAAVPAMCGPQLQLLPHLLVIMCLLLII